MGTRGMYQMSVLVIGAGSWNLGADKSKPLEASRTIGLAGMRVGGGDGSRMVARPLRMPTRGSQLSAVLAAVQSNRLVPRAEVSR